MFETLKNREIIGRITTHLGQFITDHKKRLIEEVLIQRTRHLILVLEDIYQSQNASAVFRTAECFGVQDIHLIENLNKYGLNKSVLKGADKWLTIHRHNVKNNTTACFDNLKSQGYQILATSPSAKYSIEDVDISKKMAIVLGNELHGLSEFAQNAADVKVKIPMHGFTESLNLSVSAAICINTLIPKIRGSNVLWRLTKEEADQLRLSWYRKSVKNSGLIEKKLLQSIE